MPDDNYFHLAPNRLKAVVFAPCTGHRGALGAYVEALNVMGEIAVEVNSASQKTLS